MKPGRELDALVAEKVMSLDPAWIMLSEHEGTSPLFTLKRYSSSIADAWAVVEKMRETNYFRLEDGNPEKGLEWVCDFKNGDDGVKAATAPLAISLAALKACGVKLEE